MNTTNTLQEIDELQTLAREIRENHEDCLDAAKACHKRVTAARNSALLAGRALTRAKDLLPHGKFEKWVGEHCGGLTTRTARRYMQLSDNVKLLEDLPDDDGSLIAAYIGAGIVDPETINKSKQCKQLPAPEPTKPEPQSTAPDQTDTSSNGLPEPEPKVLPLEVLPPSDKDGGDAIPAAGGTLPEDEPQRTSTSEDPEDPFAILRMLVADTLAEVERLGGGAAAACWDELRPIADWGQDKGFLDRF